jgi:hypothetical protein
MLPLAIDHQPDSTRLSILPDDGDQDDEKRQQSYHINGRAALIGTPNKQESQPVDTFDGKGGAERKKQRISRGAPELQKVHRRHNGRGYDDAEQKSIDHVLLAFKYQAIDEHKHR